MLLRRQSVHIYCGVISPARRGAASGSKVIEIYPDEQRGLLYADSPDHGLPVHIVIEDTPEEGVVVTAYIPDKSLWIANRQRRRRKRKKK